VELIRIAQMLLLFGMLVVFWTMFELWYSSAYSWLIDAGPITILGSVPFSLNMFQGLSAAFNLLLTVPLVVLYVLVRDRNWSSIWFWAPITLLITILLFAALIQWEGEHTASLLIGTTALLAIAELWISAIGLSMVSRLAPQRFIASSIGAATLAFWISNELSQILANTSATSAKLTTALGLSLCIGALSYGLLAHLYRRYAVPHHSAQLEHQE
jgi:dipeptide/tripeptide permease